MTERCIVRIEVDRARVAPGDWREDPRWDELYEYAQGLFGTPLVADGELVTEE